MKQNNALAYLRQLCCLGLDKEALIPEFLRAIRTLIPAGSGVFQCVDNQLSPNFMTPNFLFAEYVTSDLLPLVQEIYPTMFTEERQLRWLDFWRQHTVSADVACVDENFYKTDFYNLIMRRLDQHYLVMAPVVHNHQYVGMLQLFRGCHQKPFNLKEQQLLAQVMPYLAHALQVRCTNPLQYSEQGYSGMMVMNSQGEVLFLSDTAEQLLALANYPSIPMTRRSQESEVMAQLKQLCRNLATLFQGKPAIPPGFNYTNGRGRFIFRAYWLNALNNAPGGLIGVTVEHQEPLTLILLRAMLNLPLSPTQKEVALLLAQGFSSEKIGERLHIKLTTVKDHISKIFAKLDIHQREELLPKLLALDRPRLIPENMLA